MLSRRLMIGLGLLFLGLLPALAQSADQAASNEQRDDWQVIYMANQRVGYGRSNISKGTRDGQTVYVTKHEERLQMKRFGQVIQIESSSVSEENEDGKLLSFIWEMKNPPAQSTRSVGKLAGNELQIETTVGGRTTKQSLTLESDVKSTAYQERILRDKPLKPGQSISFKSFSPQFGKVSTIKVTADEMHTVKLHDNKERSLLKARVSDSLIPVIELRMFLDEHGEALRTEAPLLGMVTYTVPRDVALQAIAGAELDVAVGTLIKVPNPPATLIKAKKAVLSVTGKDVDLATLIPNSPTQSVKKIDDKNIELTLTGMPVPRNVTRERNTNKQYLGETQFLQSKAPKVVEHAERAALGSEDPGTIAVRMERYVYEKLEKKNFSTALASAAEVAERMEGDCTEHACLLAAMLRAKQIPSRVAVGFVYADKLGAFGGHMWTEAFLNNQWVPLDGTLGLGGIGASHIKLSDSDLADDGPVPVSSFLPIFNIINNVQISVQSFER